MSHDVTMSLEGTNTRSHLLAWLRVFEYRRQAAPHKAGPLCLHALHPGQWGGDDGLDALQGG